MFKESNKTADLGWIGGFTDLGSHEDLLPYRATHSVRQRCDQLPFPIAFKAIARLRSL